MLKINNILKNHVARKKKREKKKKRKNLIELLKNRYKNKFITLKIKENVFCCQLIKTNELYVNEIYIKM